MIMPMCTLSAYNKDNFMMNHPEHKAKGGKHVLKMDQFLSNLNYAAIYGPISYFEGRVNLAVAITELRQKAIDEGFPILLIRKGFLDDRVNEAKSYLLTSGERSAFHKAISKEEDRNETADDYVELECAYF